MPFTVLGIAAIGHWVVGLPWEVAFVLGAVLSPTDPVAATTIGRRIGAPPRVITVVEGEALINDSTALVAYKFAIAAVTSGTFSLLDAGLEFLWSVAAGVAIGLAVAWLIAKVVRRLDDAPTEIVISVLTPFFAYLPAGTPSARRSFTCATPGASTTRSWRRIERDRTWRTRVWSADLLRFSECVEPCCAIWRVR